jgi:hypothetical protein
VTFHLVRGVRRHPPTKEGRLVIGSHVPPAPRLPPLRLAGPDVLSSRLAFPTEPRLPEGSAA